MTYKNALITGGSRGLGLEVARLLASDGCRVTIVGRNVDSLESAIASFSGSEHRHWSFDLSEPVQIRELLRGMEGESFDILFNNAGASQFGPFSGLSEETIEKMINLNFIAPALISRQFLRTCATGATLVNITSIVGTVPMPGNTLYCAAKAGLKTLSECLWFEARGKGVRVLDFRPVSLNTDFHRLAGGKSLSASRMMIDPSRAALDLVNAVKRGRNFVYVHGILAKFLEMMNRLLPRKLLIMSLGKRSIQTGYLGRENPDHVNHALHL
jgi:short-subunit dehydrogenase